MGDLKLPKPMVFMANASLWKRGAAFLIDLVILNAIVMAPFRSLIQKSIQVTDFSTALSSVMQDSGLSGLLITISLIVSLLAVLYFAVLESRIGQSVGKLILGIYVVKEEPGKITAKKDIPGFFTCLAKSLVLLPFFPFFILWLVDPLWMVFSKNRQRLSEVITRTRVIEFTEYLQ